MMGKNLIADALFLALPLPPGAKAELGTMMKSVGEVMAMGRTWIESFQKALRGMETGLDGWDLPKNYKRLSKEDVSMKGGQRG